METEYLKGLLQRQKELEEKRGKLDSLASQSAGFAETNLEDIENRNQTNQSELEDVSAEMDNAEFNQSAMNASNEDMLDEIAAMGEDEPEPMMSEELPSPEGFEFDGSLQSNKEDNQFSSLQDLMRGVAVAPVKEEQMMSEGIPAQLPESTKIETKQETPEVDIIEKVKQLKAANPEVPLSVLMEQAKDEKRQEEADLMYQMAALQMLDVGRRTETDKSMVKDQLKKVQQNYKDNVAIAAQKDKEREEKALDDPNSPITKTMKSIAKQLGIGLDSEMTAKDLMDSGLKLNTLVGLKNNRDVAEMAQNIKHELQMKKDAKTAIKDSEKLKGENKKYYLDMAQRVGALKRGSSFKDLDTKLNAIAEMRLKLDQALKGNIPLNKASAIDLSAVWSKALTGGIPAQSLIEQTLPVSIKSDFSRAINYMANEPVANYISKKNLKLMKSQLDLLEKAVDIRKGEKLATVYNDYKTVIDSDPMFNNIINRNYGKYVKRNKDGFYQPTKALTTSGAATGKNQGSIIDKGAEAMINKVMDNAVKRNITLSREEAIKYLQDKGKL